MRALGSYDFEFFVPDDTSDEEIQRLVEERKDMSCNYDVAVGSYAEYFGMKEFWRE